jgi:SAP domain-containing ribonucleoprotein
MDATTDVSKLKVPDLKRELKLRGLATTGKRNELLERLQEALLAGVGLEGGADDDEEFDEDEILAGDDDEEDSKMTPLEEAAALAAAEKATATPSRLRRPSAGASTPRGSTKKPALKRTGVLPAVSEAPAQPAAAAAKPAAAQPASKPAPAAKAGTAVKSPAKAAAEGEPAKKIQKLDDTNKENGAEEAPVKSALELRAERFGVASEDLAKQKRAERFGVASNGTAKPGKLSMDVGTVDVDKLKARAARFGETTAKMLTTAEIDEKKKARQERFGSAAAEGPKKDVTSAEVLAARAAKFSTPGAATDDTAAAPATPIISKSGKTLITVGQSGEEAAKLKRAARFGA